MRVYIAGKITGDPAYKEKFRDAEEALAAIGHETINPACLSLPASCTWHDYMAITLKMLELAEVVCLLPEWKESPGACVEYGYAVAKGKEVVHARHILPEYALNAEAAACPPPKPKQEDKNKRGGSRIVGTRICPICGKEFTAYGRQIFCGPQCRN
ncbi:DUF4406 domain-containing protein [Emergencia sp. 1XD21-10]|nr:DUF4406 domain-containing protein [Emergencia sp. 1XD21-10]NCE99641.1 DUF4406 domain-containing protein [Emergencia sp. 1XD21-10]